MRDKGIIAIAWLSCTARARIHSTFESLKRTTFLYPRASFLSDSCKFSFHFTVVAVGVYREAIKINSICHFIAIIIAAIPPHFVVSKTRRNAGASLQEAIGPRWIVRRKGERANVAAADRVEIEIYRLRV